MRVGLYNTEPGIVNSALMRLSYYHKQAGDIVEKYNHLTHNIYDRVYAFSIFNFTPKHYVRDDMIVGGTGFDLHTRLPQMVEDSLYDWSWYPDCKFSIIWFTTGCIRKCSFCVVPLKEGMVAPIKPKNLNPRGEYIKVMDNNFFSNPEWESAVDQLKEWGQPVDFQGVDARLLTQEHCDALLSLRHKKSIHIAWDFPSLDLKPQLERITGWIAPWRLMCYVLIGYNSTPEQDLARVEILRDLDIAPFAMPYDRRVKYQRDFARWVNHKAIFKTVPWKDYRAAKETPGAARLDEWFEVVDGEYRAKVDYEQWTKRGGDD